VRSSGRRSVRNQDRRREPGTIQLPHPKPRRATWRPRPHRDAKFRHAATPVTARAAAPIAPTDRLGPRELLEAPAERRRYNQRSNRLGAKSRHATKAPRRRSRCRRPTTAVAASVPCCCAPSRPAPCRGPTFACSSASTRPRSTRCSRKRAARVRRRSLAVPCARPCTRHRRGALRAEPARKAPEGDFRLAKDQRRYKPLGKGLFTGFGAPTVLRRVAPAAAQVCGALARQRAESALR